MDVRSKDVIRINPPSWEEIQQFVNKFGLKYGTGKRSYVFQADPEVESGKNPIRHHWT
jgi:hypothetical protein